MLHGHNHIAQVSKSSLLSPAYCLLLPPTASCLLPPTASCLLPPAYCLLLPPAYCPLPTASYCLLLRPAYCLLLPLSYCQLLVHCCCAEAVSQVNSMTTMCVVSVKSRHTASTQVTMEGSARRALTPPTALVVPSLCQMTTIGILPLTQTRLSAVLTPLHAG